MGFGTKGSHMIGLLWVAMTKRLSTHGTFNVKGVTGLVQRQTALHVRMLLNNIL